MNEKEIFERIQGGDEKALELLYKKYYRMMTKLVITNSGTEDEARQALGEADDNAALADGVLKPAARKTQRGKKGGAS